MMDLNQQNIMFLTRTMGQGGTENVVLQLCEILKPYVNKIIVCSCGGVNVEQLVQMGITHYEITDIAEKNPMTMLSTYRKIKSILKAENITIVHSHHRMAALYGRLASSSDIYKIANVHNTFHDKRFMTRMAYRDTELIAVGEMVRNNLEDYFGITSTQINVIHNAVKSFDGHVDVDSRLEAERALGHILIGNIGRLSEQKGMEFFIEAAEIVHKKHTDARFVIVGDGEEKSALCKLVHDKKLDNIVIFLGYRKDVQNVMSQMDFIVLSSLWEGLPLTPIEAFSASKTVIATAVDGTPEIVKDGENGILVEPRNAEQLADKMNLLIEHVDIREKLEQKAIKTYQEEFTFEKLARHYIDYYKAL